MRIEVVGGKGNQIHGSWFYGKEANLILNKKYDIIKEKDKEGFFQMRKIGSYRNIPCYECSEQEFIDNRCLNDRDNIYIVNEKMVHHNSIIGLYDGYQVEAFESPYVSFYTNKSKEFIKEQSQCSKKTDELDINALVNQINFSDYTAEVDKFFKENT